MPKCPTSTQDTINPTLLAFKPRQLLLANLVMKNSNSNGTQTLSPDQKGPLLRAVARFLETNGFSKTLKKFLSEAEIEKIVLKESLLDLEEMYCKYSQMCSNGGTNVNSQKEKEELKGEADKNCKEKKKKKSKIVSDSLATEENSKDAVPVKEKGVSDSETEKKSKDKKKKKNKSNSDSVSDSVEHHGLQAKQDANGIGKSIVDDNPVDDKISKPKGKKKKKDALVSESLGGAEVGNMNGTSSRKDDFKISDVDAADKENKGSKKRKRLALEVNDSQPADKTEDEESKRRKVEGLKASKGSEQHANSDASTGRAENIGKDSKGEIGQGGADVSQKTPTKQLDGHVNGNLDKSAEKSSMKKSMKKQHNGSVEPKTVIAFQRVKVDEVEFVNDKLRDNSYWAKDGAEIGYGAKAQEVLGQVRGRDFRHEKTKKKRGTYRGGQIDQHSHSVKFNYSDEE